MTPRERFVTSATRCTDNVWKMEHGACSYTWIAMCTGMSCSAFTLMLCKLNKPRRGMEQKHSRLEIFWCFYLAFLAFFQFTSSLYQRERWILHCCGSLILRSWALTIIQSIIWKNMREIRHKRRQRGWGKCMFVTTIQGVYVCEYILYPFLCGQGPCLAARTEQKALPLDVHLLAKTGWGCEKGWDLSAEDNISEASSLTSQPKKRPNQGITKTPFPSPVTLPLIDSHVVLFTPCCARQFSTVCFVRYSMVYYYYIRNEFFCMNSQRKLVGIIIIVSIDRRRGGGGGWKMGPLRPSAFWPSS